MTMADKIVVMHDGIVEQMGTPPSSMTSRTKFVAGSSARRR
jgi:ABC-type Fe3+/spermidine/putrescine transport system ATPase subunit